MKTLAIISVLSLGLGFGCQQATHVAQPEAASKSFVLSTTTAAVEAPVLHVLLDTVEITVTAPVAMAAR